MIRMGISPRQFISAAINGDMTQFIYDSFASVHNITSGSALSPYFPSDVRNIIHEYLCCVDTSNFETFIVSGNGLHMSPGIDIARGCH